MKLIKYSLIIVTFFTLAGCIYGDEKLRPVNVRAALLDISRAGGGETVRDRISRIKADFRCSRDTLRHPHRHF